MIDFQVTFDKLSNFETAEEIRVYFNELGVKGFTCQASRCPIASFITEQTGEPVLVEPQHIARTNGCGDWVVGILNTPAMVQFILNFDDWCYPELVHPDEHKQRQQEIAEYRKSPWVN